MYIHISNYMYIYICIYVYTYNIYIYVYIYIVVYPPKKLLGNGFSPRIHLFV